VKDNPVSWTRSGTGSAGSTIASGPKRRTWTGSGASYCIQQTTPPRHGGRGGRGVSDPSRGREAGVGLKQNQAKSAILFLLGETLPWLEGIESAKRPARLPAVLTRQEVESILAHLSGTVGRMIRLLHGTGMRIMEGLSMTGRVSGFIA
jgi:hypothetical protein